jgi:hypothetical protein
MGTDVLSCDYASFFPHCINLKFQQAHYFCLIPVTTFWFCLFVDSEDGSYMYHENAG